MALNVQLNVGLGDRIMLSNDPEASIKGGQGGYSRKKDGTEDLPPKWTCLGAHCVGWDIWISSSPS